MSRLKINALYFSSFIEGCITVGMDLRPASIFLTVLLSAFVLNLLLNHWWVER